MKKMCTSCSVSKSFDNFYKEKLGLYGLKSICKECHKAKRNKDKEKGYNKNWYDKNREEILEKKKEYRQENKEKLNHYNLEYKSRPEVIQARKKYDREYIKQRRQEPLFKLKCNIRTYTSRAFRRMGYYKNTKTSKLLGADYSFVEKYIEAQFKKGMTWDNYGEWHIDHIKPLSSAKDEKELISLSHYTNLQPLWAIENQRKHNTIKSKQLRII